MTIDFDRFYIVWKLLGFLIRAILLSAEMWEGHRLRIKNPDIVYRGLNKSHFQYLGVLPIQCLCTTNDVN